MSTGFRVKNSSGNIIISDETYNLVYLGKATYLGVTYTYQSVISPATFQIKELKYQIDSGGLPIVPFLYNPNSGGNTDARRFGGVANMSLSGTVWTIYVYIDRDATVVPTLYCFRRITTAPRTGYGMVVLDGSGNQIYNTNANHINLKGIVAANYVASATSCGTFSGYTYCRPSYTDGVTSVGVTLTKPALTYCTQNSAAAYSAGAGQEFYFDNLAYYNTADLTIRTRWGFTALFGAYSNTFTFNIAAGTQTTLIIDGADYDAL